MQNLNQEFNNQVLGVLTEDQASQVHPMRGEAFENRSSRHSDAVGVDVATDLADGAGGRTRGGDQGRNQCRAGPLILT